MTSPPELNPAVVLLVEDDAADQLLTKEAFASLRLPHHLWIVSDGVEALDYLYRRGRYASPEQAPRPDLILLDLNMPRLNGHQVAEQIHSDPAFCDIPIVVLTTSCRHEDILRAYGHGAASFVTKPLDFDHFVAVVRDLERLIKYALALKTARQKLRMSDRQVFRLLRRQQELERISDSVFERQINEIEDALAGGSVLAPEAAAGDPRREEIVRTAQKILEDIEPLPARRRSRPAGSNPASAGLSALARSVESPGGPERSGAIRPPREEDGGDL